MEHFKFLIIGGGMVAGYAMKEFVKQGLGPGELCLVSADTVPPYQRPPLSKEFLEGKKEAEKVFINKGTFYEDSGLTLRLGATVTALDPAARTVTLADGETLSYDKALLATGSTVRQFDLPGSDLGGILTLRTLDDCVRLREHAAQAKRLVLIGGGFIGCECACRLAEQGLDTTILYRETRLLDYFLPPEISALYEGRFAQHGVKLVPQAQIAGFVGEGKVEGVRRADGTIVPADLVLVAVGVSPATALAAQAGLTVDRGVVVNEYLETSAADVYAAGDVAQYWDVYLKKQRRVDHEDHARQSGRHAARAMLGDRQPYEYLSMVWSDVYDISWEFYGDSRDADQVVFRGNVAAADFSAFWLQQGRLVGAMVSYNRKDTEGALAQEWIKQGKAVDVVSLENDALPLA